MAGFHVDGKIYPALWTEPADAKGEPIFIYVHEQDGSIGLISLDYMMEIVHDKHAGDREDLGYQDLHVQLPGTASLLRCTVAAVPGNGPGDGPDFAITSGGKVVWSCTL